MFIRFCRPHRFFIYLIIGGKGRSNLYAGKINSAGLMPTEARGNYLPEAPYLRQTKTYLNCNSRMHMQCILVHRTCMIISIIQR